MAACRRSRGGPTLLKRDFDLIVYGATGYTGRLIAEYLATSYCGDDAPSWAIAGRSTDKLQKGRADIGAPDDLPLVKADAADPASLRSMCERAAVIIAAGSDIITAMAPRENRTTTKSSTAGCLELR